MTNTLLGIACIILLVSGCQNTTTVPESQPKSTFTFSHTVTGTDSVQLEQNDDGTLRLRRRNERVD